MKLVEFRNRTNIRARQWMLDRMMPMYRASGMSPASFCDIVKPHVDRMVADAEKAMYQRSRQMVRVPVTAGLQCAPAVEWCVVEGTDAKGRTVLGRTGWYSRHRPTPRMGAFVYKRGIAKVNERERLLLEHFANRETWT